MNDAQRRTEMQTEPGGEAVGRTETQGDAGPRLSSGYTRVIQHRHVERNEVVVKLLFFENGTIGVESPDGDVAYVWSGILRWISGWPWESPAHRLERLIQKASRGPRYSPLLDAFEDKQP